MTNPESHTNTLIDWVMLGIQVAASGATLYLIWRAAVGPDVARMTQMKVAKGVERFAMSQAIGWAHVADRAAKYYEKQRPFVS